MLDTRDRSAVYSGVVSHKSIKERTTADYGKATLKHLTRSVEGIGATAGFLTAIPLGLMALDIWRSGLYVEVLHNQVPAYNVNPGHFILSTLLNTFLNDKLAEASVVLAAPAAGSAVYHAGATLYNGAEFGYHGVKGMVERSRRQKQTAPIRY